MYVRRGSCQAGQGVLYYKCKIRAAFYPDKHFPKTEAVMKRVLKISALFLIAAVLFSGCYPPPFLFGGKYSFFNQPNHEWISEECGVRVISHEKGEQADLIILSDGREYTFEFHTRGHRMLYGLDENMVAVERWSAHYHKTKACITVYSSKFFEENEKFTLYLVED